MEEPVDKQTPDAKRIAEAESIIKKELSNLSGNLALRCGRLLAVANAFLITAKHVDFSAEEPALTHPSRDSDGYPLAGQDEVPNAKQSSVISE